MTHTLVQKISEASAVESRAVLEATFTRTTKDQIRRQTSSRFESRPLRSEGLKQVNPSKSEPVEHRTDTLCAPSRAAGLCT
ncbi:hypothetical protein COCOBI_13-4020 [Coccomyxa sp. Obi]|nr:hypothetical protein COCOBI_13-4020 [Coccomyxa sp. Obi]